ncbi:hypothetical protein Tco_0382844 [Tanacetum coccineum]
MAASSRSSHRHVISVRFKLIKEACSTCSRHLTHFFTPQSSFEPGVFEPVTQPADPFVLRAVDKVRVEEKLDRKNEMKARGTLLMALPNKDQMKLHSYQDTKVLMEAIEKRYGGNKERTLLKQQYENFADMNLKLLRSLPSEWKIHTLIWRNKVEIKTISLDDLYNNLKIYELVLKDSTNTSQNSQNMAFVSSNSTNSNSSTNEADNTAYGVSTAHTQSSPTSRDNLSDAMICAFLASQPNSP